MKSIDFLPERIKEARAKRRRLFKRAYLLVVCGVAMAALGYVRQGRISKVTAELAMFTERSDNMRRQLAMRSDLERQQAELMVKKRISDQLGSRVDALEVLAELGRLMPKSMSLTSLNLEAIEVAVSVERPGRTNVSARAAGGTLKPKKKLIKRIRLSLAGIAPTDVDVAGFIGQLSASPLFEDVNMGYTKTVTFRGRSGREFQADCYVVR